MKFIVRGVLFTVLVVASACCQAQSVETFADLYHAGQVHLKAERYDKAQAVFAKALGMPGISDTDKADVQLQIALSYYEAGDHERAKPELEKVLTMPGANVTQQREDGWANYVPSREAKLRLLKMKPSDGEEKTITALFIGSSMTLRGYMPRVVEAMAASAPAGRPRIMTAMYTRGGLDIDVLWEAGDGRDAARGMIGAVPWDVVVLETFYTMSPEDLLKYGKLFADLARKRSIVPVLYECHPEFSAPYLETVRKFHKNVADLGKTLGTPVAPVALAEVKYLEAVPAAQREVFYADGVHPSEKGVYLEACCIYSAITGYSPVGLYHPENISDDDAKALQDAAWKAVQETNPNLKPWK